ncbi:glycosyltransferase [Falsirhodobacter sp. 1013]|uniref:glycosyltransferase n=1 Tax=Falsirhodobacter sp. 1013 TaxID=3417566 RepID=UPI003EBFE2C0
MISRTARRLFARYALRHMRISCAGFPLRNLDGTVAGHVERVVWTRGGVSLCGWTTADSVALLAATGLVATVTPRQSRRDVAQQRNLPDTIGFVVEAALPDLHAVLLLRHLADQRLAYVLPPPTLIQRRVAQARLVPGFCWRLIASARDSLRWERHRDQSARSRIKRRFGLDDLPSAQLLEPGQLNAQGAEGTAERLTIILPVFNALDLLPEVLERVLCHTDLPFHLIVIEDCSTDPGVRPFLRAWAQDRSSVQLIENETNLGFIGSVNRAFDIARRRGDPVVLLNSDAFVPEGWASRLLRPLADASVATVTPMSNDAEIFSVPLICQRTMLRPGEGDAIDRMARRFGAAEADAPTGVGFCMAIQPQLLERLPAFDTIFGRGYGEEVDWCQKARALGFRHVGIGSLFVEHRGGESFGSDAKLALVQANNSIVTTRYPGYDLDVQRFIQADPLRTVRLALAIAYLGARAERVPVHLAHSLGGGAEIYLQDRLQQDIAATGGAVVLRVGGFQRWQVEVHLPGGVTSGVTDSDEVMWQLLDGLPARHVIYGCGVGDADPVTLPAILTRLAMRPQDRLDLLFHDYFPVSPSYCLLDSDGCYCGDVFAGTTDPAHSLRRPEGGVVTLPQWQEAWKAAIEVSTEITVFSQDTRRHVVQVWPEAGPKICVRPHVLRHRPPAIAPAGTAVGVLGNIGLQKGAAVIGEMGRRGQKLVVIGDFDPAFPLPPSIQVHGAYGVEHLPALVQRYGIGRWLIPSIWPETFSFTTHEALATGLPVFCFDLGAQGEAVGAAPNGRLVPFHGQKDLAAAVMEALASG